VRQADLCNHATEIGIGVVERLDDIDHAPVVEAESGEVFECLDRREPVDQAVVAPADPEHQRVLLAGPLNSQNHGEAVFPVSDEFGNELGRILEIRHDSDDGVAGRLVYRMEGRTDVAEVPGVDDDPDVGVLSGDALQNFDCAVRGGVVDENVLVGVAPQPGHHGLDPGVQLFDVVLFVVTTGDDADGLHRITRLFEVRTESVAALQWLSITFPARS